MIGYGSQILHANRKGARRAKFLGGVQELIRHIVYEKNGVKACREGPNSDSDDIVSPRFS
jgi:hypothetical protein